MKGQNVYMKPHERVIYILALVFGVALAIAGIVLLAVGGFVILGSILLAVGVGEIIGVAILLWTEGVKKSRAE